MTVLKYQQKHWIFETTPSRRLTRHHGQYRMVVRVKRGLYVYLQQHLPDTMCTFMPSRSILDQIIYFNTIQAQHRVVRGTNINSNFEKFWNFSSVQSFFEDFHLRIEKEIKFANSNMFVTVVRCLFWNNVRVCMRKVKSTVSICNILWTCTSLHVINPQTIYKYFCEVECAFSCFQIDTLHVR